MLLRPPARVMRCWGAVVDRTGSGSRWRVGEEVFATGCRVHTREGCVSSISGSSHSSRAERFEVILDRLSSGSSLAVNEVARDLGVSAATIRRDFGRAGTAVAACAYPWRGRG